MLTGAHMSGPLQNCCLLFCFEIIYWCKCFLSFWQRKRALSLCLKILIITGNVLVCHFLRLVTSMGLLIQILMGKLCKLRCVGIPLGWCRKLYFHVLRFGRWGSKIRSGPVAAPLVLGLACEIHFQCSSPSLPLHKTGFLTTGDKVLDHVVDSLEQKNVQLCQELLTLAFIRSQGMPHRRKEPQLSCMKKQSRSQIPKQIHPAVPIQLNS